MFGLGELTLSFLRRQVGLRTDAADASGGVLARLKYIINSALPSVQKPRGLERIVYTRKGASNDTWTDTTVLNLSGRGVLRLFSIQNTSNISSQGMYEIVVDGVTIFPRDTAISYSAAQIRYLDRFIGLAAAGTYAETNISFRSSLQIVVPWKTGWIGGGESSDWFAAVMFLEVE